MMTSGENGQIDLTYLRTMSDDDEDFIKSMITSFINNVPVILNNIQDYHQQESWEALAKEIHKLKPTLKYLGVQKLNDVIILTETNCKAQQNFQQISNGVDEIVGVAEDVITEARGLM